MVFLLFRVIKAWSYQEKNFTCRDDHDDDKKEEKEEEKKAKEEEEVLVVKEVKEVDGDYAHVNLLGGLFKVAARKDTRGKEVE